ncbi:MAG: aminoglycoside phosphotransferase family protein [Firmicutes bacterium]|nr:aminoglycoside phosphotransferase family protein [Bacillota bacterium]
MKGPAAEAATAFRLDGSVLSVEPYGQGHIHHTFRVATAKRRYLLQRLNTTVFPDPRRVMENVARVLDHLRAKLEAKGVADLDRRVLQLMPTQSGEAFWRSPDDHWWRCYLFIEPSRSLERPETRHQAFEAGRAFGAFQTLLEDLPGPTLQPTLPGFHDAPLRLTHFEKALQDDPLGRASQAMTEIAWALQQRSRADLFAGFLRDGTMAPILTHNDTKLNNLLFDERGEEALCVLDLDTVMPGLPLYDFGDLARSACNRAAEDGPADVDAALFLCLAEGFQAGRPWSEVERDHAVEATQTMAYTLGLRFLTDFLEGDSYFRIHRPDHNLHRARGQFALVEALESRKAELKQALAKPA